MGHNVVLAFLPFIKRVAGYPTFPLLFGVNEIGGGANFAAAAYAAAAYYAGAATPTLTKWGTSGTLRCYSREAEDALVIGIVSAQRQRSIYMLQ